MEGRVTDRDTTDPVERVRLRRRGRERRKILAGGLVALLAVVVAVVLLRGGPPEPVDPATVRGSPDWAAEHYGDPAAPSFERRNVVEIEFLGRAMFVHKGAKRHFFRLERLFEARAPEYAAAVASGELDDWSYLNRDIRGGGGKSNHAFGLAVDINALSNPVGTAGDMPPEVVSQWKAEGGEWGGDWSRPDPMHFETHLTPDEITKRYKRDGTPRAWYLEELVGAAP